MSSLLDISSVIFKQVRQLASIEEFLSDKGLSSIRKYGDKAIYNCPIHKGDKTPSFYVYKKDDGDDFYCFGCKKGGSVVHLKSYIDSEKFGKSLVYFCDKLKIIFDAKIKIEDIIEENLFEFNDSKFNIDQLIELCAFRLSSRLDMGNCSLENCLTNMTMLQKAYEQRDEKALKDILDGRL